MKRRLFAVLIFGFAALPLYAEVIECAGILGNSGEQGAMLVRFNADKPTLGLGVVFDRHGTFWDRGGKVLNRYAVDGRLLGSYPIPCERPSLGDAIVAIGDMLMLCLDQQLYTFPIEATEGAKPTPLKIPVEQISRSSHEGWVAAAKGPEIFLVNGSGEKKSVTTLQKAPQSLELGPDGTVYVNIDWKTYKVAADVPGGLALVGGAPGERMQFLGGFIYGASWASTIRRFDTSWQPAPGVILGGNSGSFIGHVDEQSEIINERGMAKAGPDLFAVSGRYGILHLLEWQEQEKRFNAFRRIGAVAFCPALALDREGRTWWESGNWNWDDGPATPLHFGIPALDVFGLTMQNPDSMVGCGLMYGKPSVVYGKLDKEIRINRIEKDPTALPKEGVVAVAVVEQNKNPILLVLQKKGDVLAVKISDTGDYQGDIGPVQFITSAPVMEWTSLVATSSKTLIGAGDGFVIELVQDGNNWKESRRWNSWGQDSSQKFGGPIWLSANSGKLWVSDSARHRVICFDLASGHELAAFGKMDASGDDLAKVKDPRVIAAQGARAVVFDSGNQRLVKLQIKK